MERKPTLVVALGGNALLKRGEPLNRHPAPEHRAGRPHHRRLNGTVARGAGARQRPAGRTAGAAKQRLRQSHSLPAGRSWRRKPGMIGYMLQQALKNNLPQREVSVLLTQVEVDAADPAFSNPTKYIGPVYSEARPKRWPRKKAGCLRPTAATSAAWCRRRSRSASSRVTPSRR